MPVEYGMIVGYIYIFSAIVYRYSRVFKMNFSKLNFLTELGSISFGLNHFRIFVSSFLVQIQASYSVF